MYQTHQDDYFCLNMIVLSTMIALEELLGENGIQDILSKANLSQFINNYPTDDLDKNLCFADFSSFILTPVKIYGTRRARSLALKTGSYVFDTTLKDFGAIASMVDPAFVDLPLRVKLRIGIFTISKIISYISGQKIAIKEEIYIFIYSVHNCPVCWRYRDTDKPVCNFTVDLLKEGLKWFSDGIEFVVHEVKCIAMGDDVCEFEIQKEPRNMLEQNRGKICATYCCNSYIQ